MCLFCFWSVRKVADYFILCISLSPSLSKTILFVLAFPPPFFHHACMHHHPLLSHTATPTPSALLYRGLQTILRTGNITLYPALCAQVTATFAVLSDTINTVRNYHHHNNKTTLSSSSSSSLQSSQQLLHLLKQLQEQERDKLNYTAALHLEQMRQASAATGATATRMVDLDNEEKEEKEGKHDKDDGAVVDERTHSMLESGISSLRQRIVKCVEEINQVLEELRCLLMEEEE